MVKNVVIHALETCNIELVAKSYLQNLVKNSNNIINGKNSNFV